MEEKRALQQRELVNVPFLVADASRVSDLASWLQNGTVFVLLWIFGTKAFEYLDGGLAYIILNAFFLCFFFLPYGWTWFPNVCDIRKITSHLWGRLAKATVSLRISKEGSSPLVLTRCVGAGLSEEARGHGMECEREWWEAHCGKVGCGCGECRFLAHWFNLSLKYRGPTVLENLEFFSAF